jgi:predicted ATPase/transcriptional regulator with XRE-family HTH domain
LLLRDVLVAGRKDSGWTQEELAERSGVSVRTIRNLEAGVIANPRRASVDLLLAALGVSAPASPLAPDGPPASEAALVVRGAERTKVSGVAWQLTPAVTDAIVGREQDVRDVVRAVQRSRVVVLTGPAGVGKTRLTAEVVDQMAGSFQFGVAVAELGRLEPERAAGASAFERVRAAVDAALQLAVTDIEQLHRGTHSGLGRQQPPGADLLLVVDNAEHVLDSLTRLLRQVITGLPRVHVLVTSRRVLPMISAYNWDVEPLPVDFAEDGRGRMPAAVELFLRRAEASCPALDLTQSISAVTQLCRRLDGIPLALELAAARIRSVSVEAMLRGERITQILGQSGVDGLPHQRCLADSVRWSYELLDDGQRGVLHNIARFSGRFTIEDVERGPLPDASEAKVAVAALGELVDASLVQVQRSQQYSYRLVGFVQEFVNSLKAATLAI